MYQNMNNMEQCAKSTGPRGLKFCTHLYTYLLKYKLEDGVRAKREKRSELAMYQNMNNMEQCAKSTGPRGLKFCTHLHTYLLQCMFKDGVRAKREKV